MMDSSNTYLIYIQNVGLIAKWNFNVITHSTQRTLFALLLNDLKNGVGSQFVSIFFEQKNHNHKLQYKQTNYVSK